MTNLSNSFVVPYYRFDLYISTILIFFQLMLFDNWFIKSSSGLLPKIDIQL